MRRFGAPTLSAHESIGSARELVRGTAEPNLLVRGDFGWASFPAEALETMGLKLGDEAAVRALCTHQHLPTLHPDEPLDTALRLIEDRPLLPVVRRTDQGILQGVLGLQEILQAYRRREEESQ